MRAADPQEQLQRRILELEREHASLAEQARRADELEEILREQAAKLELLHAELRALQRQAEVKDEYIAALRHRHQSGAGVDGLVNAGVKLREASLRVIKRLLRHVPPLYRAAAALRRRLRSRRAD